MKGSTAWHLTSFLGLPLMFLDSSFSGMLPDTVSSLSTSLDSQCRISLVTNYAFREWRLCVGRRVCGEMRCEQPQGFDVRTSARSLALTPEPY